MIAFIQYLQAIRALSPELITSLLRVIHTKYLRKGQVWLQEGSVCDQLGFVEKGLLKMYCEYSSRESILFFSAERNIAINAESFLEGEPSRYCIRAVVPSTIHYLTRADLLAHLEKYAELNYHLSYIGQLYGSQQEKHTDLLMLPSRERVGRVFQLFPWMRDEKRLTDKLLAGFIGLSPASVCYFRKSAK